MVHKAPIINNFIIIIIIAVIIITKLTRAPLLILYKLYVSKITDFYNFKISCLSLSVSITLVLGLGVVLAAEILTGFIVTLLTFRIFLISVNKSCYLLIFFLDYIYKLVGKRNSDRN